MIKYKCKRLNIIFFTHKGLWIFYTYVILYFAQTNSRFKQQLWFRQGERLIEPSQKWLGKSRAGDALPWCRSLPLIVFFSTILQAKQSCKRLLRRSQRLNCAWNGTSARKVICPFSSIPSLINFIALCSVNFFSRVFYERKFKTQKENIWCTKLRWLMLSENIGDQYITNFNTLTLM